MTGWIINEPGSEYRAFQKNSSTGIKDNWISQKFLFRKAIGKKAVLTAELSDNYPGDGACTLVNGVQNEKGLSKSDEFPGFNTTDCEISIDPGSIQQMNTAKAHVFDQLPSWIYGPTYFQLSARFVKLKPAITEQHWMVSPVQAIKHGYL